MRSILITVMLIITVILIYTHTIGGTTGTKAKVRESGTNVNVTIQSINP